MEKTIYNYDILEFIHIYIISFNSWTDGISNTEPFFMIFLATSWFVLHF